MASTLYVCVHMCVCGVCDWCVNDVCVCVCVCVRCVNGVHACVSGV